MCLIELNVGFISYGKTHSCLRQQLSDFERFYYYYHNYCDKYDLLVKQQSLIP